MSRSHNDLCSSYNNKTGRIWSEDFRLPAFFRIAIAFDLSPVLTFIWRCDVLVSDVHPLKVRTRQDQPMSAIDETVPMASC